MTKTIAAALTLTAALIAMPTWADPMAQSSMSKHDQMMQDCMTKAKAKNDGMTEATMKQSCWP